MRERKWDYLKHDKLNGKNKKEKGWPENKKVKWKGNNRYLYQQINKKLIVEWKEKGTCGQSNKEIVETNNKSKDSRSRNLSIHTK